MDQRWGREPQTVGPQAECKLRGPLPESFQSEAMMVSWTIQAPSQESEYDTWGENQSAGRGWVHENPQKEIETVRKVSKWLRGIAGLG